MISKPCIFCFISLIIFIAGWSFAYWQYNLSHIESTSCFAMNIKWLDSSYTRPNFCQYGMYMFVHLKILKSKIRLEVHMECAQNKQSNLDLVYLQDHNLDYVCVLFEKFTCTSVIFGCTRLSASISVYTD